MSSRVEEKAAARRRREGLALAEASADQLVPVAVIGLLGNLGVLGSLALPESPGRTVTAFLALAGAAFSLYLTWVEVASVTDQAGAGAGARLTPRNTTRQISATTAIRTNPRP